MERGKLIGGREQWWNEELRIECWVGEHKNNYHEILGMLENNEIEEEWGGKEEHTTKVRIINSSSYLSLKKRGWSEAQENKKNWLKT